MCCPARCSASWPRNTASRFPRASLKKQPVFTVEHLVYSSQLVKLAMSPLLNPQREVTGLICSNLMGCAELLHFPHCLGLVIVGRVSIPKDHLNPALPKHGSERDEVHPRHSRTSRPCVPKIIEAKPCNRLQRSRFVL